jgi:hypothetical protein
MVLIVIIIKPVIEICKKTNETVFGIAKNRQCGYNYIIHNKRINTHILNA